MNLNDAISEYKSLINQFNAGKLTSGELRGQAVHLLYKIGRNYKKIGPQNYDKLIVHVTNLANFRP